MTHSTYHTNEINRTHSRIADLSAEPLHIRQERRAEFARDMADSPELVAERVEWLIDGNYGYGAYQLADQIRGNKRMNRVAALSQLVGSVEWECSSLEARKAFLSLNPAQQAKINAAIAKVLADKDACYISDAL